MNSLSRALGSEFRNLVIVAFGVVLLRLAFGSWPYSIIAGLLGYCGWHLYNVTQLNRWLTHADAVPVPDAPGIWGLVFKELYHRRKSQKQANRKLKMIIGRFENATKALPDGIVILGEAENILACNESAERLLHLQGTSDLGLPIRNFIRDPGFGKFLQKKNVDAPYRLNAPGDESRRLSVRIVPVYASSNQHMLIVRDVTRLYKLENMRRDFVANISHELKTPLTVIKGYLETMLDGDTPKQWCNPLNEMDVQSDRMVKLIDDLIQLNRIEIESEQTEREDINVAELVAGIVREAQSLSAGKHKIEIDVDGALWIHGDKEALRMAMSNLVSNAVYYTPPPGAIKIRWARTQEDGASFVVKDSGVGVDKQDIPRLTERFYRTRQARKTRLDGTGIGLAIVKHVMAHHTGELTIDSTLDEGTRVTCEFPQELLVLKQETLKAAS